MKNFGPDIFNSLPAFAPTRTFNFASMMHRRFQTELKMERGRKKTKTASLTEATELRHRTEGPAN
jgi:hypothetical protein